ncbi:MAG: hypothetical protein NUV56_02895 [Candidatus Uhrbacteria bacterium]|nr:hypothetical protein [Candidatus Uhrbacteria bacterium]
MGDVVIRIPWNKQIAKRLFVGLLVAVPLVYALTLHGLEKYRIGFASTSSDEHPVSEDGWIVTLRYEPLFQGHVEYEVCLNGTTTERVYVRGGAYFDSGGADYFDKNGQFMSSDSWGAGGEENTSNGELLNLHFCQQVPRWFWNVKTKPFEY